MNEDVLAYLKQNADRFESELHDFLRIPSVSADSAYADDMEAAAGFVAAQLTSAGVDTKIMPTKGHPIVFGRWTEHEGGPTAVVYGHYDVQPPDPVDHWTTPPFEPTVRDGKIYARGATDDKGQMFTHVKSVEAWLQTTGSLPMNVVFVIEGEEEVGSDNLDDFLREHASEIAGTVGVISDTSQYGPGRPAITYGLRGIMAAEVTVKGPKADLHSGMFGGAIANPVNGLARMIAGLHDETGRVTIPGFYDGVKELTEAERQAFGELGFDEQGFLAELDMDAPHGEEGFTTLERRWARPTCDINGIFGGYTGEGPKTIVPARATAKISCRLVPDQDPEQLTAALETHLRSMLLPGLTMEFRSYHGCGAFLADPTGKNVVAAKEAVHHAFGTEPVLIREGGSIPVASSFQEILGIETLLLGWGLNTDNLHSPDEHFTLADFHHGIEASARLWERLPNGQ